MPVGILINVAAVLLGGILGCLIGGRLPERWKNVLSGFLGLAALTMGIALILRHDSLSPVILALITGGIMGEALRLEQRISALVTELTNRLMSGAEAGENYLLQAATVIVLFCFSGTGWYGALYEGMTGDGSILITKAILDGVTACIFGALLGRIVPLLALPQLAVMLALFFLSGLISPFITPAMNADFSAMGGIITLAAGLRMTRIKTDIRIINLLPSLPLVFVFSALWKAFAG